MGARRSQLCLPEGPILRSVDIGSSSAGRTLVLRRSWDKRGLRLLGRNWPWILGASMAALAWSVSASAKGSSLSAAEWIAGTVAAITLLVAMQEQGRLFVAGDEFGESKWPRRRRSFPISEIGRVRRITRRLPGQPPWPHVVVVDRNGNRLLDIQAVVWTDRDLDAFFARLGVHPEGSFDEVVGARQFDELFPRGRTASAR